MEEMRQGGFESDSSDIREKRNSLYIKSIW